MVLAFKYLDFVCHLDSNLENAGKMKRVKLGSQARKAFQGSSRGFSLIEVAIAIALIGILAVAIMGALSYASTVLILSLIHI